MGCNFFSNNNDDDNNFKCFFYFLEPLKNTDDELIKAVRILIIFAHLKEF